MIFALKHGVHGGYLDDYGALIEFLIKSWLQLVEHFLRSADDFAAQFFVNQISYPCYPCDPWFLLRARGAGNFTYVSFPRLKIVCYWARSGYTAAPKDVRPQHLLPRLCCSRKFCLAFRKIGTADSLVSVSIELPPGPHSFAAVRAGFPEDARDANQWNDKMTNPATEKPPILREARPRERFRSWSATLRRRFSLSHREGASPLQLRKPSRAGRFNPSTFQPRAGFTLLELLIVLGIIGILLVLMGPAFTSIKGGNDVTSAAYTIKGVLETARTYAISNDTYTWVGFYEEDVSQPSISHGTDPCTGCVGRLVMSIVASKDRTTVYDLTNPTTMDRRKLFQVGKLTKIDNVHLWTHTDSPNGTGSTLDTRPNVASGYCIGDSSPSNSLTPFQYPVGNPPPPQIDYTFRKVVQFSPTGEARINNNGSTLQPTAEIALQPTHGAALPGSIPKNSVAIQFTGIGANVRIYRR